jgi:hypothetical protein
LKQAESYFVQKRYILSATCFALSKSLAFEEMALKFMGLEDKEPLKVFLVKRLETFTKKVV